MDFALNLAKQHDKKLIKKIGIRLRDIRNERGITQEEFIYDTGIHIGRIETGTIDITISTLKRICVYYNITLEDLFKIVELKK